MVPSDIIHCLTLAGFLLKLCPSPCPSPHGAGGLGGGRRCGWSLSSSSTPRFRTKAKSSSLSKKPCAGGEKLTVLPHRAQTSRGQSSEERSWRQLYSGPTESALSFWRCLNVCQWLAPLVCNLCQKMPHFGDDWQPLFYCWKFLSSNGNRSLRGVRVQSSWTVRKDAEEVMGVEYGPEE